MPLLKVLINFMNLLCWHAQHMARCLGSDFVSITITMGEFAFWLRNGVPNCESLSHLIVSGVGSENLRFMKKIFTAL